MNEESFWQAVQTRDPNADGVFFYAVRSTGIYCRPTCPSRRPRRDQVLFFQQYEDAESAGFRACQRCHPRGEQPDEHRKLIEQACELLDAQAEQPPTLAELGAQLGMSAFHLQRTFKRIVGVSPRQYAETRRIERLKERLKQGDNVTTALYEAGYSSSSRLYEQAPERLGMTPATYRRGGLGAQIGYTITDSPFGRLLVATTKQGICFVSLADDDDSLRQALHDEYPAAVIERAEGELAENLDRWVSAIHEHLRGQQPHALDLPIDVRATAFQSRVWQALREIPYGSTRSYRAVAEAIGQPTAVRAVARACATNPVALVVPCHRVIGEDGEMRGYRWGTERKREILAQEAQQS